MLYTDGLYEVERDDGEEFGETRLLATARRLSGMPLASLFPSLTNEACLFAKQGGLDDDVCMVGLHFKKTMQ
jgi:serine phosphatase RsbU (regulator of sigma subunit)